MKQKPLAFLFAGTLLFILGILLELFLSSVVAWGEIEARVYSSQVGDLGLNVKCPLMLSPTESGTISTSITNTLDVDTKPVVTADISRVSGEQQISQTLLLAAHETQTVQWEVDASNILFGRLILVNVTQFRYTDLPSRQGACGIFLLSFLGLSGVETFYLLFVISLAFILLGAWLWFRGRSPLDDFARSSAQASGVLASATFAGLLVALPRWWGLIIFFDVVALILIVVILTEFVLFPKR